MRGVGVYLSPVPAQRATFLDALPYYLGALNRLLITGGYLGRNYGEQ